MLDKAPPNGITTFVRRFVSIAAALLLFGLIVNHYLLDRSTPPPLPLLAFLFVVATAAHDRVYDIILAVTGKQLK